LCLKTGGVFFLFFETAGESLLLRFLTFRFFPTFPLSPQIKRWWFSGLSGSFEFFSFFKDGRLRRRKARNGHPVGRAAHVIHPAPVAELDRGGITPMLTADSGL